MTYQNLGRSGLLVSSVGLGCNNLGRPQTPTQTLEGSRQVVAAALEAGITTFDLADIYGGYPGQSEEIFGQILKDLAVRREDIVIISKFGLPMGDTSSPAHQARGSRRYLRQALEASLKRLGTDYLDLYIHHTPDASTPVEETLTALGELVAAGKVRYLASSNYAGWQIAQAHYLGQQLGSRYIAAENHYNLLDRRAELEVIPACQNLGLGLLPYFPLANGLLTGKYRQGQQTPGRLTSLKPQILESANWEQLQAFSDLAQQAGMTELELAFSWLAAQEPVGSVIAGATSPQQVEANASALKKLGEDLLAELDRIFPAPEPIALF